MKQPPKLVGGARVARWSEIDELPRRPCFFLGEWFAGVKRVAGILPVPLRGFMILWG